MSPAKRTFGAVVALCLLAAGCSDSDGPGADTSTSPDPTDTVAPAPTPTSSPPVVDMTAEPPPVDERTSAEPPAESHFARGDHEGLFAHWDLPMNADGTAGSGCNPPTGELPDGRWFGSIGTWTSTSISFTLLCIYHDDSKQYKDYNAQFVGGNARYVTDPGAGTRTLATVRNVPAWHAYSNGQPTTLTLLFAEDDYTQEAVWVFVNDGIVTEVVEDYTP